MHPRNATSIQFKFALLIITLLVSACSSSSSDDTQLSGTDGVISSELDNSTIDDGTAAGGDQTNDGSTSNTTDNNTNENQDNSATEEDTPATPLVNDPTNTDPANPDPIAPDPLVQNFTQVTFDIQVPAYQSDALQVRVVWDDKDLSAAWVGDEFWSASDDFPTDTAHPLTITFYDGNGDITLGSYEAEFKTGTNASESFQITADQFDTDRWDSDGNGISNLDQLIAGNAIPASPRVLLFSETRDFRHDSTETAIAAIEGIALSSGMQSDRAADSEGLFNDVNLANYDVVVWVMTSGDVLDADEQGAFERFIRAGGGYVGIHAASFTEYEWPWYGQLVGAYFDTHPAIQSATQVVEDGSHLSTSHLGSTWTRTDEWYDYRTNPRAQVNVLLTLDEDSYSGGTMGADHPSAWYHDFDGGRSWYTGGGHTDASYNEPDFRAHLLGGLRYAAGQE